MNILASYQWLKDYVDIKETPEQLAARVSLSGPGIEKLYPQGKDLEQILIGQVKSVSLHPNADKLRIAEVMIGANKTASIVCGGSNLETQQWVVVALPGASVKWHGEGEPVILEPTEIRGVKSDGMICAANEIGLFDAFPHTEREILDLGKHIPELKLKPGTPIAEALGLSNDTLMDVEVTTNRPDILGMVGLAREVATILKHPFLWKPAKLPKVKKISKALEVTVQNKKLCSRYLAIRIDQVKVKESPWWLKRRLLSAGLRPINNLVDITNYVMLELAQPMHVFDAEKVNGGIQVRTAKKGETLAALDGKTYELSDDQLIIADQEKPLAIAGIMGGEHSSVTKNTTSVIFEAASFNAVAVRRAARALNLYSDAQQRFEKGLSQQAPEFAMARAIELCLELAGGEITTKVIDKQTEKYKPLTYTISVDEINAYIGVHLKPREIKDILKRLGFILKGSDKQIKAEVPWWRDHDIEDARDLVEEIARMYGYAHLPITVPAGVPSQELSPELAWEGRIQQSLKGAGFTETISYSFVSKKMLDACGYKTDHLLKINNPLSEDFEFLRTTLLPSMIQTVAENQERFRNQQLFEIANVYYPKSTSWTDLPNEQSELAMAVLDPENAFKKIKGAVEFILQDCGISPLELEWKKIEQDDFWHPTRSAQAFYQGTLMASIGEIHPSIRDAWKIEGRLAMADIPLVDLIKMASKVKRYHPTALFPESTRDIALIVAREVSAATIQKTVERVSPLIRSVEWFDTYTGEHVEKGKKSVAFHLSFGLPDRTLTTEEIDQAMQDILNALEKETGAKARA